jgi:hypothetical protein
MNSDQRAPAAALGLFLFLAAVLPCGAADGLSLAGKTGALWADRDGAALYWGAGLSYKSGGRLFAEMNTGQLISSLAWADGDIDVVRYRGGFDSTGIGLRISGGFFRHDFFNADFGNSRFYNDGGRGYFINSLLKFHLGPVDISPSFLFGQANWDQGSFYWFFGRPDIPATYGYGLSAVYNTRHLLNLRYVTANLDIFSNDGEELFTADVDCFTAWYTLKGGAEIIRLEGTLGWLYAAGTAVGALTMSNQNYVFFPFRFFNVTGSMDVHLGYGLIGFVYNPVIFHFNISLGAANIFWGGVDAAFDYRMKKLFGGSELRGKIDPLSLANTGAAFLMLDAGIEPPTGSRSSVFLFGFQKAFVIPWGYDKLINPGGGDSGASPPADKPDTDMWRTILLSGLSFYLKLSW